MTEAQKQYAQYTEAVAVELALRLALTIAKTFESDEEFNSNKEFA